MSNLLMGQLPGELMVPVKNRMSFLYLEFGQVVRQANSVVWRSGEKEFDLPIGNLSAILLGSGSSITQAAMAEAARFNCNVSFVYGAGIGTHASFLSGSTRNARILEQQVNLRAMNRLGIARDMYALRWGLSKDSEEFESLEGKSIEQMRGMEGSRMKKMYTELEQNFGFQKILRGENKRDFTSDSPINQQITALYQVLYGISNSVILSLGLHPSLGFIHASHTRAFVFDVADLYKEEFLWLAYEAVKEGKDTSHMRGLFRDSQFAFKLIPRMVDDVLSILKIRVKTDNDLENILEVEKSSLLGDSIAG